MNVQCLIKVVDLEIYECTYNFQTYTFEKPAHCHGLINNIDTYSSVLFCDVLFIFISLSWEKNALLQANSGHWLLQGVRHATRLQFDTLFRWTHTDIQNGWFVNTVEELYQEYKTFTLRKMIKCAKRIRILALPENSL